jgi:hypothetical protein
MKTDFSPNFLPYQIAMKMIKNESRSEESGGKKAGSDRTKRAKSLKIKKNSRCCVEVFSANTKRNNMYL